MERKRILATTLVFLIPAILMGAASISAVESQSEFTGQKPPFASDGLTITVTGTSIIKVEPTQAVVWLGVTVEESSANSAWQKSAEVMENIIKNLKELGIAENDIRTTNYNIYPRYDKDGKLIGYASAHEIEVKVRDIKRVGEVIDVSVSGGANRVNGIQFTISDEKMKELQRKAVQDAAKDAKVQADSIASAFGAKIVKIVAIMPEQIWYQVPRPTVYSEKSLDTFSTPIEPGVLEISGSITVTYEIGWPIPIE
jgi:uncharacterized protein YggE